MKYYMVDAFTDEKFKGNQAGVCILDEKISLELMQKIAMEHNLAETAFARKTGDYYELKWFTPQYEMDLCGHATLATAFVICSYIEPGCTYVEFETLSGRLTVERKDDLFVMTFPNRMPKQIEVTNEICEAIGFTPVEAYSDRDLYVVCEQEEQVSTFEPDYTKLAKLNQWLGVVLTARGNDSDFVSRFFCPDLVTEDAVTGSSHTSLIPLWSEKLGKKKMLARQLSKRSGTLYCEMCGATVKISGKACVYLKGEII